METYMNDNEEIEIDLFELFLARLYRHADNSSFSTVKLQISVISK